MSPASPSLQAANYIVSTLTKEQCVHTKNRVIFESLDRPCVWKNTLSVSWHRGHSRFVRGSVGSMPTSVVTPAVSPSFCRSSLRKTQASSANAEKSQMRHEYSSCLLMRSSLGYSMLLHSAQKCGVVMVVEGRGKELNDKRKISIDMYRITNSLLKRRSRRLLLTLGATQRCNNSTSALPQSAKVDEIVDQIATLNLLETASLVQSLKQKLNIADMAMPMGGVPMGAAAPTAADAAVDAAAAAPAEEKSVFNIKLEAFDAANKAKVIKEVKALLGLNLVEAKKTVEAAPKVLKEGVTKEDAEKIKKVLEDLNCKVVLE